MSCDETMEYMQRELDNDLAKEEFFAMKEHLNRCPECQNIYTSLQKVSLELEKLPQIEPPFSIVDGILPQLKAEASVAQTDGQVQKERQRETKMKRWKNWSIVAGGLAAAVCVWVLSDKMFTTPNLNDSVMHSENATEGRMLDERTTELSKTVDEQGERAPTEKPTESVDERLLAKTERNDEVPLNENKRESQADQAKPKRNEPNEQQEQPVAPEAEPKPKPAAEQERAEQQKESKPTEDSHEKKAEDETMLALEASESKSPAKSNFSLQASPSQDKIMNRALLAPQDEAKSSVSPDGQWIARARDNRIIITDRAGTEVFRTKSRENLAEVNFTWIDETHLQYDAQSVGSNKLETWFIDIEAKREKKQSR